jgi:MFS family permease
MGASLGTRPETAMPVRSQRNTQAQAVLVAARVPAVKMIVLSLYWVAIGYLWQGLHTLILPDLMLHLVGPTFRGTALGFMENLGLLVATAWQPIVGALSDHTSTRWGRRRPYILGGTVADIPFLIGIALIGNYWLLVAFYILLQTTSNTAHGPYQALMPDVVPEEQRGEASGYYGFFNMIGLLAGVGGVGAIAGRFGMASATLSIIVVLVIAMAVTVLFIRDHTPAVPGGMPGPRRLLAGTFAKPVRDPDFMWISACRLLIFMALIGLQTFMYFYLYETWFPGSSSQTISGATIMIGLLVLITALASLPAGRLSDRFGRRSIVVASGALASLGFAGLMLSHYVWVPAGVLQPIASLLGVPLGAAQLLLYGFPIGIGLGAFMTVNWAQMTDIIPKGESGSYMGFFNIATAGAGVLSRLIGGGLLDFFNAHGQLLGLKAGYPVVFAFCGLLALAGGLIVLKARETRQRPVAHSTA